MKMANSKDKELDNTDSTQIINDQGIFPNKLSAFFLLLSFIYPNIFFLLPNISIIDRIIMLKVILLYYIQAVISIILTFNMKFPRIDSVLEKKRWQLCV